jgi:sigma-B regulation protein RsbU (phosphoserine phosphatase)
VPASSEPAIERGEEWARLVRLAGDPLREGEFLIALTALCRREIGASGAALYADEQGTPTRVVEVGEAGFPARLPADEPGLVVSSLRGGALAAREPAREPAAEHLVLLSTALRVRDLHRQVKRHGFEANLRGVELQALYDVGLAITSMLELDELSEGILLRAVSLLDARRGALYFGHEGGLELGRTIGGNAAAELGADDPAVSALLAGKPVDEQRILPGARFLEAAPIEGGEGRGLIVVADKESRTGVGPFRASDRRTLELFANQASIALENARLHREALEKQRLEREMELAAEIQKRLLPTLVPELRGFEITGWSRPAREIGGDYYDFIALTGGTCGLVVGDVSGKGVPAALMVSTVHSALRLLLDRLEVGPELLERLNRHIAETSTPNKFITFFMAEVDASDHTVQFLNAGHNPAILLSAAGDTTELETGGLPLGLLPDGSYRGGSVHMDPGDLLCIYSDGITEALSVDDEEFGIERLTQVLRETRREPLEAIISAIDGATADFALGMPQADDQTLLLLRRLPAEG